MGNIFSYAMDGPRIEYYIIYLTPVCVDLSHEIVGLLGHTSNIIDFSASAGYIRDKDGLEKVFASAR